MNPKQIRYVLTLAREKSFSAAAEELNIKQPSLSQYIRKIENEIGMELFDRSGGDVRLTDAGKAYLNIGRKVLDLEHRLEAELSDISEFKMGTVTIGISAHRSVALMPAVVKAFKSRYPGICLRIVERNRRDLLEAAEHGEFDLVVTTLPVDRKLFEAETLFVEENVIAAPAKLRLHGTDMPGRRFPVISADSLDGLPFAMLNEEHLMQRELGELIAAHDLHLKKEVECTSLEALLEMVKEGLGAALIPTCLAKPCQDVSFYSIRETIPKREIVVLFRKEQCLSKALLDLKQVMHIVLSDL